jgi:hypothetical protein
MNDGGMKLRAHAELRANSGSLPYPTRDAAFALA